MNTREILKLRAYELAEEVRAGRWDRGEGVDVRPVPGRPEIVAELERRCPGFDRATYERAIADGLFETR